MGGGVEVVLEQATGGVARLSYGTVVRSVEDTTRVGALGYSDGRLQSRNIYTIDLYGGNR